MSCIDIYWYNTTDNGYGFSISIGNTTWYGHVVNCIANMSFRRLWMQLWSLDLSHEYSYVLFRLSYCAATRIWNQRNVWDIKVNRALKRWQLLCFIHPPTQKWLQCSHTGTTGARYCLSIFETSFQIRYLTWWGITLRHRLNLSLYACFALDFRKKKT